MGLKNRKNKRDRRHMRIRQRIHGTADRPRMAICVSNKHFYVQFIDDVASHTLASISSLQVEHAAGCNLTGAKQVGEQAARVALDKGIRSVVIDRGGFRYHGRVKQIVESAVAAGLSILNDATRVATEEAK